KPCIKINMQDRAIPLEHNIFNQANVLDNAIKNLKISLLTSNKVEQNEWDSLMEIEDYLNDKPDSTPILSDKCADIIKKSIDLLDDNEIIPLLELINKLSLNSKIKASFVTRKDKIIIKLVEKYSDNKKTEIQTFLLKILCNWCNELEPVRYLLSDIPYENNNNKSLFINYLTNSLLSENEEIVIMALKLLNNISLFKLYINIDDEERDINIISSIVQLLQNKEILKTSVTTILSSFYLNIFENQQSSIPELLNVFDIKSIINNIIKSFDEEIKSIKDVNIKKEKELLRDLCFRIIAMVDYIQ
ncbi:hypothetical protein BCR36DRAFT_216558, partial [Piromyces finnis]